MSGQQAANKELFNERVKEYDLEIKRIQKYEKDILHIIKGDRTGASYKKLALVNEMIYLVTLYLAKFKLSVALLGGKNENVLNEARKTLYKPIIYLEEVVGNEVDDSLSEQQKRVSAITAISEKQRYYLIRKLGLAIDLVIEAYGENTKWRWSFAELEGRFAVVTKNIMDLKKISKTGLDPQADDYDVVIYHLRLVKKLLSKCADKYREKYEVATNTIGDFRTAIQLLEALKKIHLILNEHKEVEEIKRKLEIWNEKLEKDIKKGKDKTQK